MQSTRSRLAPCLTLALAACAAPRFPQLPYAEGPAHEALVALALSHDGDALLVLERRTESLSLALFHRRAARLTPLPALDAGLREALRDALPDAAQALTLLRSSPLAAALEQRGLVWLTTAAERPWPTHLGRVVREDSRIIVTDGEAQALLAHFTDDVEPIDERWLVSADGEHLAIEMLYSGEAGAARDLRLVARREADAQLLSARASTAHERRSYDASTAMWREALEIAPERADLLYNVACGEARRGNYGEALAFLRRAIMREPQRFRLLARYDRDFTGLRKEPAFQALTAQPTSSPLD